MFEDVTLSINPGDRIGLVGPNGAGKTTLLKILTGEYEPVRGAMSRRKGLAVAVYDQDAQPDEQSGGECARERLAHVLADDADLIILDEPTNHLDMDARRWLERKLIYSGAAVIAASHDRVFLSAFATRIVEVERGKVTVFNTGYDEYREVKEKREAQKWADYEGFERRKAALERAALMREKLAVKVARTPDDARSCHDFYNRKAAKVARTGRMLRERTMDPGTRVDKPWEEQPISELSFENMRPCGDFVLQTEGLSVEGLFDKMSFYLRRGERLAVTGPNGCGKTTLLRTLMGLRAPDGGKVHIGHGVEMASIEQLLETQLDMSQTPLEVCGTSTDSRTLLACLKVPVACLNRPLSTLSGGERTKVAMARILNSSANLLLLDEPTNHLEIAAQEALEAALQSFPGTVIAVSHDRAFLQSLGEDSKVIEF